MIAVSDSFKKAIKSDNREIHGYVDVVYDKQEGDYSVTQIPTISPLSKQDGSDLIDDIKVMKNYATLENNYFLLDGSFILANTNTLESSGGYMSEDILSNIQDRTITLVSTETGYVTTKGFTIFFKDNIPFDFDIVITTEYGEKEDETITINVENNNNYKYQHIFDNETNIKKLELIINTIEYQDRRLRIADINLSLTNVYQGEELVNFTIDEEINIMLESIPINTCSINLNNYPNDNGYYSFDPINPQGITNYLTRNTTIKPYIGILTEENGIEYVPMGIFYLTSWNSKPDGNVTLNGSSVFNFIKDDIIKAKESEFASVYNIDLSQYNYNFSSNDFSVFHCDYLKEHNLYDYLLSYLIINISPLTFTPKTVRFMYVDRNNMIRIKNTTPVQIDTISRSELLEDIDVETNTVVNKVTIKNYNIVHSSSSISSVELLNTTYKLNEETAYVWFDLSGYNNPIFGNLTYTVISGSATVTLVAKCGFSIYVKIVGTENSVVNVKYSSHFSGYNTDTFDNTYSNNVDTGESISIDTTDYGYISYVNEIAEYLLNNEYNKYTITANTIGDPSLEAGDMVSIETRYNTNEDTVITKQKFTYDGGLQCELEGVGR